MTTELASVFGLSNTKPLSYVVRLPIESAFKDALQSSNALVVYGASKQGKTTLVSRYVKETLNKSNFATYRSSAEASSKKFDA